ncbi:MAG: potassium channel family protein [Myxococcaceae bacterium]
MLRPGGVDPKVRQHRRRVFTANVRYLWALCSRFRFTFVIAFVFFVVAPAIYVAVYRMPDGSRITFGAALHHVYFLLFGQPSLPYVGNPLVETLNLVIPPLGIAVVVDGIVRFAYLYFAKHRSDKEWIAVISKTYQDHVVICGAGRVGFRVATQLVTLGKDVVVVEKREDASFVGTLRDMNVPVLIDDLKSGKTLERVNVQQASAIVCATDDDLANLNAALDARRLSPHIRVVIRLFDDDLVAKVKDTFKAEALSSSALAAPAMALSALDPRIVHSFQVSGQLMVVSVFGAKEKLPGLTLSEVRDRFGALCLAMKSGGQDVFHPRGNTTLKAGDEVTLQATYENYLKLREFTGEKTAPTAMARM